MSKAFESRFNDFCLEWQEGSVLIRNARHVEWIPHRYLGKSLDEEMAIGKIADSRKELTHGRPGRYPTIGGETGNINNHTYLSTVQSK
jgi:hypothetical protein